MSYSDKQMIIASQIAYIDFNSAAVDSGQYTVRELLQMEMESASGDRKSQIQNILNMMNDDQGRECADWILKDICNDRGSGMYGCMLETGNKEAVIAFRGSEEMSDPEHLVKDWIGSDLGLVNSTLTPQQAAAEQYLSKLYRKYGDSYDSFGFTGHSLGGNLAEHAAITAPDSMRNKIGRCLNLDGPGFSQTYLIAHANDINKSRGLIDHYQWSVIGTLLNTVPGTNYQTVKAETPDDKGAASVLWRHDTRNIKEFDQNGNMLPGEKDWLSRHTKEITSLLDVSLCLSMGTIGWALLYNYMDLRIDSIRNLYEKWREEFTGGSKAEFAIQTAMVNEAVRQWQDASEIVRSVQAETDAIRRNLPIKSLSAGYIKYQLWRTQNSIGQLENRIRTYASKGEECVQTCQRYDRAIADRY